MEEDTNELTVPLDDEQEAANRGEVTEAQKLANEQLERQIQARAAQQASTNKLPVEQPSVKTGMFARKIAEAQQLANSPTPTINTTPEQTQSNADAGEAGQSRGGFFSRLLRKQ